MLKNKKEREEYIRNEDNWIRIPSGEFDILHYAFSKLVLPDGSVIIREDVNEKDEFNLYNVEYKDAHVTKKYRILCEKYITAPLSMTFLIDYLGKLKIEI